MTPKADRDKLIIEALVRRHGPLSRGRIHARTGIRLSATSELVRELLAEGRLIEAGIEPGHLGRKGVLLQCNEQHRTVIGIEFDDESVSAGVTDLGPRMQCLFSEPTTAEPTQSALLRQLRKITKRALESAAAPPIGIAIADPGLVDSRRGITLTSSTLPFWKQVPLRENFHRAFGLPVLVETRTRAKAVAEHDPAVAGSIYIDYGSGIGAGLYVDGRLLYGESGSAGEFGHTRVASAGPLCACGARGCLEAVAGLRTVPGGWRTFAASAAGDREAQKIIAGVARHLGSGIANLVNLFNPGLVVLDARLAIAGRKFLDQITDIVQRQALPEATSQLCLRYARVQEGAGVLGAASLIVDQHFKTEYLA